MEQSNNNTQVEIINSNNTNMLPVTRSQKVATNEQLNIIINSANLLIEKTDKPISTNTKKQYKAVSNNFTRFIELNGFNFNTLKDFKSHLQNNISLSISTKVSYLCSAKVICKSAYSHEVIKFSVLDVPMFQQNKEHKKDGLTTKNIHTILEHTKTIKKESRRLKIELMVHLLAFQGLRSFEMVNIKVSDIDLKNQTLKILGKGRDDIEIIPILHDNTKKLLKAWIELNNYQDCEYIFSSTKNRTKAVSTGYVRELFTGKVKNIKGKVKIVKGVFCKVGIKNCVHGFRHFFVTWLLEQGYTLTEVQQFSRHRTFETIKVYDDRRLKGKLSKKIKVGFSTDF